MIVGISGYKRSGKDAFANLLIKLYPGYAVRLAFADKLKAICQDLFELTDGQVHGSDTHKETVDHRWGLSSRQIMQRFGTEVARSVHPDVWVRCLLRQAGDAEAAGALLVVVPDVRFVNEADAIRERGGLIIRVTRPGCVSDGHASEALDFEPDIYVANEGGLADLEEMAQRVVTSYLS